MPGLSFPVQRKNQELITHRTFRNPISELLAYTQHDNPWVDIQIEAGDAESLRFDVLHSGETVRRNVPFPAGKLGLRTVEPDNESSPATQAAESPSETTAVP